MSETAGKIVRTGTLISYFIILVLSIILFLTHSIFIIKILLIIAGIFLIASLTILVLNFTGFYKFLKLSNPTHISANSMATIFMVISGICVMVPTIYGMLFIPEFVSNIQELISNQQTFMSNQQESMAKSLKILEGLEKVFLTPPVQ